MKFPAHAKSDFAPVPAGNHVAICNAIIDLGLQPGSAMYPESRAQVYVRFELPDEQIKYVKDGEEIEGPMSIGRMFTASMNEKASLRKFVESWRGASFTDSQAADFDLHKLLGQRCLLNVTHNERDGKTYANITTATPLPKGMQSTTPQHNPSLFFDLNDPDQHVLNRLPQWLQDRIAKRLSSVASPESNHTSVAGGAFDPNDDIPF